MKGTWFVVNNNMLMKGKSNLLTKSKNYLQTANVYQGNRPVDLARVNKLNG